MTTSSEVPVSETDPRRERIRSWLRDHPEPSPSALAGAGLAAPHWPAPWGLGSSPMEQLIIEDELRRAGVKLPLNPNGFIFIGPSLLTGASPEQLERYLPPLMSGEELWCRLYSEPDAGSDLASIRTRAVRDGEVFRVTGSKSWAPMAQIAKLGGMLVRTSGNPGDADGLTYLICPMDSAGITLNPVVDLAGGTRFNELFFDDVAIPVANVVGSIGAGLAIGTARARFERVSLGRGAMFGNGPTATDLIGHLRRLGALDTPSARERATRVHVDGEILRLLALHVAAQREAGRDTNCTERARKIALERHGRDLGLLACDLLGAQGTLSPDPADAAAVAWHAAFLSAPSITFGAGATELQLDELGNLILGFDSTG